VRQRLARLVLRIPGVGRLYLKALLKTMNKTPRSKLPAELQQLQTMLKQIPKDQQLALLQDAMKGRLPQPEQLSREMRRAAARQQKRRR
jgi:hypothetical protein